MKLIDEKEVADEKRMFIGDQAQACFEYGVEFAEQKLLPMMVEFANYAVGHNLWVDASCTLTTEQLLEQFIKNRTK